MISRTASRSSSELSCFASMKGAGARAVSAGAPASSARGAVYDEAAGPATGAVRPTAGASPKYLSTTSRWATTSSRETRRYSSTASCRAASPGAVPDAVPDAMPSVGAVPSPPRQVSTRRAGRSPPGRQAPSAVRTRCPSTSHPGRRGAVAGRSAVRPRNRASGSIGTPAAASRASTCGSLASPDSPGTSNATAVCGRPPRMCPTRPVSTRPGPASTKVRTPAAYMSSICSTKRTGAATWSASIARTAEASRS